MTTLPPPPARAFASDNAAGAHPAVLEAVLAANAGSALAYGDDDHTRECAARFRDLFGADVTTRLTFNGTGANIVALATLLGSLPGPTPRRRVHRLGPHRRRRDGRARAGARRRS